MKMTYLFYTLLALSLSSWIDSTDENLNESTEIFFKRTVTSHHNSNVNGVDTIVILKDGDLIKESNFYDDEFYIHDTKKKVKSHYYHQRFDKIKCYYQLIDTVKYTVSKSSEQKEILGYNCTKETYISSVDTIEVYVTDELDVNYGFKPSLKINGCVLEMTLKDAWSQEHWQAVKIENHSKNKIAISDDYIDDESEEYKEIVNKRPKQKELVLLKKGDVAPQFSTINLKNEIVDLAKLRNKVVVLNFWFIGCTGCVAEMPDLNKLVNEFKNEDVSFISFTYDSKNAIYKFLRKKQFQFQIVPNTVMIDKDYGVFGYPSTIIIDKKGNISEVFYFKMVEPHIGYTNLVNIINQELEK